MRTSEQEKYAQHIIIKIQPLLQLSLEEWWGRGEE